MRIGIVIRHCSRKHASRYALETSRYFVQKGHEVHIFANKWDSVEGVKFHKIPVISNNFQLQEMSFSLFATLNLQRYNFDVTIAQSTRYFSPSIAEIQFVYKAWSEYKKKNGIKTGFFDKALPLMEGYNLRKAKKIIALSNSVKNEIIQNYGIENEKIKVIYSGADTKEFSPSNKIKYFHEIREKYNIPKNAILLLFVGNPFLRKGLDYVIKAMPLLHKNVRLLVMGKEGPDPNNKASVYQKMARELKIEDKVIFQIGLTQEISKYFAASDIFVFPTQYEPFGLVILEAMASGLPVVTTKLAGAAELIEDGKDGLLLDNPKSSDEIARKLNYLIENDAMRRKVGKNARKKAEKYTWKKTADEMLKVFEESIK